jgi:hypothetical protein
MQSCNMNWCTFLMPELLLEIEDRMDSEQPLFLQFHRGDDMLDKVKGGYQSAITRDRIDVLTSSVLTNSDTANNPLKYVLNVNPLDYWKLIRNIVRLSNDNQNSLFFISQDEPHALRMEIATTTLGHRRMMFTQCVDENYSEILEEVYTEKPDVVVSDMSLEQAEETFLIYQTHTRKSLIWIQVPTLRALKNDKMKSQYESVLKSVMAPYHLSKVFINDTVRLYKITEFLRKENG